jgi:hypothetical protein
MVPAGHRVCLTGHEPVYAVSHRRPGGARTWYGVHSPGRTHVLVFRDAALAGELARGLAGYHDLHAEYPSREWSGHCDELGRYDEVLFESSPRELTPADPLSVEELRLDLFMRHHRGSGLRYTLVYGVEASGALLSRDYAQDDLRAAPAWLDRVAGLTSCPPGAFPRDFPAAHAYPLPPPLRRPRPPPQLPCDSEFDE